MPIDAVFTWVDGADPAFKASREALASQAIDYSESSPWRSRSSYTGESEAAERAVLAEAAAESSQAESRFRNIDELRFALRSVEQFAPWIRRIFLVTNGQIPKWLAKSNKKIVVIKHSDIFPDPDNTLPTFNSNAIELNITNIPGLSSDFIYFNDDFFLGRPVNPSDFKTADGRYRLFTEAKKPLPLSMTDRSLVGHMWAFNHALLEARIGREKGRTLFAHTPQMYNKRLLQEVQLLWWEECDHTRGHRFRTPFDVAMRILYTYYTSSKNIKTLSSRFDVPPGVVNRLSEDEYVFVKIGDDRTEFDEDLKSVLIRRPKFFCINDEIRTTNSETQRIASAAVRRFLLECFPEPSSFEIDGVAFNKEVLESFSPARASAEHKIPSALQFKAGDLSIKVVRRRDETSTPLRFYVKSDGSKLYAGDTIYFPSEKIGEPLTLEFTPVFDQRSDPYRGFSRKNNLAVICKIPKEGLKIDSIVEEYIRRSDFADDVISALDPILTDVSSDPMAHFLLADRALRGGKKNPSIRRLLDYAQAGGVDPFWVCHRRGLYFLREGERQLAARNFREAIRLKPNSAAVFSDLADALTEFGHYIEADLVASVVLQATPDDKVARYVKSLCRYHFRDPDPDAAKLIEEGASPRAISLWADIQIRRGEVNKALFATLNKAALEHTGSLDIHLTQMRAYLAVGDAVHAARIAPVIVKLAGGAAAALVLARREYGHGSSAAALLLLDASRAKYAWITEATAFWAHMLMDNEYYGDDVKRALYERLEAEPSDHYCAVQLARVCLASGEWQEILMFLDLDRMTEFDKRQLRDAGNWRARKLGVDGSEFLKEVAASSGFWGQVFGDPSSVPVAEQEVAADLERSLQEAPTDGARA